jgi:tRNA modification GTPase
MKHLDAVDTICAIASPPGPSLRSIIRISGPQAWMVSQSLFHSPLGDHPPVSAEIFQFETKLVAGVQACLRLQFWPSGRSYTGQELIELHLPGPNALAEVLMTPLLNAGARMAQPGEFSLRAFLSGRIDLTSAEAIAGIFQATSQNQLEVALNQLAGGLAGRLSKLRDRLLDLLAWLEATLDFVEEADVSPIARNLTGEELRGAARTISALNEQYASRVDTIQSPRVLLAGPPNAGKSALFNALTTDGRSLVSPVEGTTRDYLEGSVSLSDGVLFTLVDTAGLADSKDSLDAASQQLARREQLLARLIIDCRPADQPGQWSIVMDYPPEATVIRIMTKSDLMTNESENSLSQPQPNRLPVSTFSGEGLQILRQKIVEALNADESAGILLESTRARARDALVAASAALTHAAESIAEDGGDELVAMDLRQAVESLDLIMGRDVTEEMLDRIFSRFCIGK